MLVLPALTALTYAIWRLEMSADALSDQVTNSWLLMITISNATSILYYFVIFRQIFNVIYADWQSNMELDSLEAAIQEKNARGQELTEEEKA